MRTTLLLLLFVLALPRGVDAWEDGWSLTGFHGWYTDDALLREALQFQKELDSDFRFGGLALNKRLGTLWSALDLEGELQLVEHYGAQRHHELVGLVAARWKRFPWTRWLLTGVAAGVGVSWTSEKPTYELEMEGDTTQTLAYILFELELGLPRWPNWALVGRIHHRSTAYGLFFDRNIGANAYALGLKYRF